jgi:hypothetical protein
MVLELSLLNNKDLFFAALRANVLLFCGTKTAGAFESISSKNALQSRI